MRSPARGRFPVNLVFSIAGFAVTTLAGLWFTRFLIHTLGVEAYGLIPLAMTFVSYLSIGAMAVNASIGRYLTIALEQRADDEANLIFNTALLGNVSLIAILTIPATWAITRVGGFVSIPLGLEQDVVWLMAAAYAVFALTTIANPFDVSAYCRNRFDLRTLITSSSTAIRIGIVVFLFNLGFRRLGFVSWGMVAGGLVHVALAYAVWRYLTPTLHIRPRSFSLPCLRRLGETSAWVVINQVGALLFLSIDLLVINRLLGSESAGTYAIPLQLVMFLRGLTGVLSMIMGPRILYFFASGDRRGLIKFSKQATKFIGLVMALPIGLILGLSQPLLRIWLGEGYQGIAPLLAVMVCHLPINLAVSSLFHVQIAANRVRVPALVTLLMGGGNLLLAICLVRFTSLGIFGVPLACAIMLTLKNAVFTPIYTARIVSARSDAYVLEIALCIVASGIVAGVAYGLSQIWRITSVFELIGAGLAVSGLYVLLAYSVLLGRAERRLFIEMVRMTLRS